MPAPERVIELVDAALPLGAAERGEFLARACGGDAALLAEAQSLLALHGSDPDFLEAPLFALDESSLAEGELKEGDALGDCRVVSLLGTGGMGEVYLAQDTALERRVAIKLIQRGLGGAAILRRFAHERRVLAALNHPHIARLYGGGGAADGRPYLVMEYVEGERLDHFCRRVGLGEQARLELFRKICSAVAYAHQNLVIHRDLKPGNILVTAEGDPKLLDFGIAKLLDPEATADATVTMLPPFTPAYASPEQLRNESISTASDIYALGIVLREMLTGERDGALKGDLATIAQMATRPEPARRYASVAQLSEDVRRYLAGWPVVARKDALGYRAGKFVRRNKALAAAAALLLLSLVGGLGVSFWQARAARQERDRAQLARRQSERLNKFLQDLLSSADPAKKGKDVTVVQVLDAASATIDAELASQPEILAQAQETISRAYLRLQVVEPAEKHARAALAIIERLHGADERETVEAEYGLAEALLKRGGFVDGEPLLRKILASQRRSGADPYDLAMTLSRLADALSFTKRDAQAAPLIAEALRCMRQARGEESKDYITILDNLSIIELHERHLEDAAAGFRREIAYYDHEGSSADVAAFAPRLNLCIILFAQRKLDEMEAVVQRLDADCRRLLGEKNLYFGFVLALEGIESFARGKYAQAIPLMRRSLAIVGAALPPTDLTVVQSDVVLGIALTRTGAAAEGEPFVRAALEHGAKCDKVEFENTVGNLESALGECLFAQKRFAEAEPLLVAGYEEMKPRLGAQHPLTRLTAERLRAFYTAQQRPQDADRF